MSIASRATTESNRQSLYLVLLAGTLLRLASSQSALPSLLVNRPELTTPVTSWTRLLEGLHLFHNLGQDPYVGGSFHQAPLLLLLPLLDHEARAHLIWCATEVGTAFLLARIADARKRTLLVGEGEKAWEGWRVAALYLLHPFSLATSSARSTIVFTNLFIALSISSAQDGESFPSPLLKGVELNSLSISGALLLTAFSLSIATHLSLYPILLLPPLALVLSQSLAPSKIIETSRVALLVSAFALHQVALLLLSNWMTGSWNFLHSFYGVILTIPDLTPTIGLGWYFFTEMFDHFRAFFVGVFQLHTLVYVAPLTFAFRKDPLFAVVLIVGVIGIFKTYPSLGDIALWHSLLSLYSELGVHLSRPLLLLCLTLYSLCLLPTFHHLWLYSGSGNSNFFYASTLVWTISQGGIWVDFLAAYGRRGVLETLGEKGRERVREGEWKIVQR